MRIKENNIALIIHYQLSIIPHPPSPISYPLKTLPYICYMKRLLLALAIVMVVSIVSSVTYSQVVYEPVTNNRVYELLDELATLRIISINSVVKPYSRVYIAEKLMEAKEYVSGSRFKVQGSRYKVQRNIS